MTVSWTGTTPTPFGFVGKGQYQTDSDSGLQLLGHRYYDASIGRFISSDPVKEGLLIDAIAYEIAAIALRLSTNAPYACGTS